MKKIKAGGYILITGAILFLSGCIVGGLNMPLIPGWDANDGKFWTSINNAGFMSIIIVSIIVMSLGFISIALGYFDKKEPPV